MPLQCLYSALGSSPSSCPRTPASEPFPHQPLSSHPSTWHSSHHSSSGNAPHQVPSHQHLAFVTVLAHLGGHLGCAGPGTAAVPSRSTPNGPCSHLEVRPCLTMQSRLQGGNPPPPTLMNYLVLLMSCQQGQVSLKIELWWLRNPLSKSHPSTELPRAITFSYLACFLPDRRQRIPCDPSYYVKVTDLYSRLALVSGRKDFIQGVKSQGKHPIWDQVRFPHISAMFSFAHPAAGSWT